MRLSLVSPLFKCIFCSWVLTLVADVKHSSCIQWYHCHHCHCVQKKESKSNKNYTKAFWLHCTTPQSTVESFWALLMLFNTFFYYFCWMESLLCLFRRCKMQYFFHSLCRTKIIFSFVTLVILINAIADCCFHFSTFAETFALSLPSSSSWLLWSTSVIVVMLLLMCVIFIQVLFYAPLLSLKPLLSLGLLSLIESGSSRVQAKYSYAMIHEYMLYVFLVSPIRVFIVSWSSSYPCTLS